MNSKYVLVASTGFLFLGFFISFGQQSPTVPLGGNVVHRVWVDPLASVTIPGAPAVTNPPDALFMRARGGGTGQMDMVARNFYKKYIDVKGLSLMASGDVADLALQRTYDIVTHMLAGRPDVLAEMGRVGTKLIIIGKDQVYTDMPEYRNTANPDYQNERVRGTGGINVTSFGEENLLNLPLDRYDDESIGVHEFCHTIDAALRNIDNTWNNRLRQTYQNAIAKGRWHQAYTGSNQAEYWAEICQSYFDNNRMNNWNHANVGTREQLKEYDPEGYELCRTTFNLTPENDWRYSALQKEPSITPPPEKFKINPYYTKFTWAREFTVVGSDRVSDDALLQANDTIRNMFRYRHDILKALINEGIKLVVLGRGERLVDLPEFASAKGKAGFDDTRVFRYTPELKLLVVPEENVLNMPKDPFRGESAVLSVFANAVYQVCCLRPFDPNWEKRPSNIWQQYELHVTRVDENMDKNLQKLYETAMTKGLWRGTPAARDRGEYFTAGILAYYEGTGAGYAPYGGDRPITTRELLKSYDPELYQLVDTMLAYTEHDDWRYRPYQGAK